jgi:homogentisate 1,2-dioxygenase
LEDKKIKYIAVEGVIGVGKTSLAKKLSEKLNAKLILENVDGNFASRKGIDYASISLHPNGIPHGPHPGTVEANLGKKETLEVAVMMDTFRPLKLTTYAEEMNDPSYYLSWNE